MEFEVVAKQVFDADKNVTILIIGNETGGRVSINLTVKKVQVATTQGGGGTTSTY